MSECVCFFYCFTGVQILKQLERINIYSHSFEIVVFIFIKMLKAFNVMIYISGE